MLGALRDVSTSSVCKRSVPNEVLSAMETTPVPVSAHHGTYKVGVILVRGSVVDQIARLDVLSRRCHCSDDSEGKNFGDELHCDRRKENWLLDVVMNILVMS